MFKLTVSCLLFLVCSTGFAMPERYVPRLQRMVSFLGLGTVELGRDWGIDIIKGLHPNDETAKSVLQTALKQGMTVVDSATSYQLSEERIGRFIPRHDHHYLLITKPGEHSIYANDPRCQVPAYDGIYCKKPGASYDFSRAAIVKDVQQSLKFLNVKKIDMVLLHLDNNTATEVLQKGEALQTLKTLKRRGLIDYIGVSVNGSALALAVKENIDAVELEYNLLNQTNRQYIDAAHAKGMMVIVRGGLGTGLLTQDVAKHINDKRLPFQAQIKALLALTNNNYDKLTALALAFLYSNKNISTVIVGADRPELIVKDVELLKNFSDQPLLTKAIKRLQDFPEAKQFTEIMGEFYAF